MLGNGLFYRYFPGKGDLFPDSVQDQEGAQNCRKLFLALNLGVINKD